MPLIRDFLNDLDITDTHIVYGAVVMGYVIEEVKPVSSRKDVIHIIC
jgi:hypothetical protein